MSQNLDEYFDKLELDGIKLTDPQKWWYEKKFDLLGEDMLREYPSTAEEAFQASQEGYWYASYIKELYDTGHITNVSLDRSMPVYTAWDLGQRDACSIWFFQITRSGDINLIDFWQKTDCPLDQISIMLKSKSYNYATHIWPSDANARDRAGVTFVHQARNLDLIGIVLEQHSFMDGINKVRMTFNRMWFDKTKCLDGLKMLENYKKKWNSSFGGWTSDAVHDSNSHCADAIRYLCCGLSKLSGVHGSVSGEFKALRSYWGG